MRPHSGFSTTLDSGAVLGQRKMSSGVLVVDKIPLKKSTQRSSIPYDYMVQTFPANGSDQPLHVRILPWRSRCSNHFLHPHAFRDGCPVTVVDRIAVAQKISAPVVPGARFPHLLRRPLLAGVFGHLKVQHTTPSMRQDHEHKQNPESRRRHHEEEA